MSLNIKMSTLTSFLVICLVIVYCKSEKESTTRQSIADETIENTLNDKRYLQRQLKCALGESACDPVGRRIKSLAPLVLRGSCPECSEKEVKQIKKVLAYVQINYPKEWNKMLQQYASG